MTLKNLFSLASLAASASACAIEPDQLAEETQDIDGALFASQWQRDRAVKLTGAPHMCTATRISARFAITAAHCHPELGQPVGFYDGGPGIGSGTATIVGVANRPGVDGAACEADVDDCYDGSGNFADVTLIQLAADPANGDDENDLEGPHATLAWKYPGDGVFGTMVGAGSHFGLPNPNHILKQAFDTTDSLENGWLRTVDDHTDTGDSGGPLYVSNRILGVLAGEMITPLDDYDVYTNVPTHLNWILSTIGYSWRGQPSQSSTSYGGTVIEAFTGSTELTCQYACEKTSSCEAYVHNQSTGVCGIVDNVSSVTTQSGWRGALKHGARSGNSNDVVGYRRSFGIDAVVHTGTDGLIHELRLQGGNWIAGDLGNTPGVASKLSAYRRSDNTNCVVYRSTSNHIIEVELGAMGWQAFDLTNVTGGENPSGNPVAYVRSDGVSAIVYRGATTGHIIELRLGSMGWRAADLTVAAGNTVVASSDPSATVRSDGQNSVVFRAGTQIWELFQANGQNWNIGIPSGLASAPAATGRPFNYTHRDGTNAIVYRMTSGQVIELFLSGSQWNWGELPTGGATGDPIGYVRTDGVEAVVYRSGANIMELTNTPWQSWNLSSVTNASATVTNPAVYHRTDGHNVVLFETAANHAIELRFKRGGSWAAAASLTTTANETP